MRLNLLNLIIPRDDTKISHPFACFLAIIFAIALGGMGWAITEIFRR